LMGGDLIAVSTFGEGSTFTLELTLKTTSAAQTFDKTASTSTGGTGKPILIVEDNEINRDILKMMLEGLGHRVVEAEHGLAALEATSGQTFDLIFMDINMPVLDGIAATRRIREQEGPNQDTHIVGLTAHGRQEFEAEAKDAGMDTFCMKPLRLSDLRDLMGGIIPKQTTETPVTSIDPEIFANLRELLGEQKLETMLSMFDRDIDDITIPWINGPNLPDEADVSAALHKLRGASAALGLEDVAAEIDKFKAVSFPEETSAFVRAVEKITAIAKDATDHARSQLTQKE